MATLHAKVSRLQMAFHSLSQVAMQELDALRHETAAQRAEIEALRARLDAGGTRAGSTAELKSQQNGTAREVELMKAKDAYLIYLGVLCCACCGLV